MITRLVIEIDHENDTHKGWHEGDKWTAADLREYIEHEGITRVRIEEWELRGAGARVANPDRINNGTMAYKTNQAGD